MKQWYFDNLSFVGTNFALYNCKYCYLFILAITMANILLTTAGFLHWKHGPTAASILAGSATFG